MWRWRLHTGAARRRPRGGRGRPVRRDGGQCGRASRPSADSTALPFDRCRVRRGDRPSHALSRARPDGCDREIRRVLRPGGTLVVSTNAARRQGRTAPGARRCGRDAPAVRLPTGSGRPLPPGRGRVACGRTLRQRCERHDLRSEVRVPESEPVVAFIDSTRSWYGDGPEVHGRRSRRIVTDDDRTRRCLHLPDALRIPSLPLAPQTGRASRRRSAHRRVRRDTPPPR